MIDEFTSKSWITAISGLNTYNLVFLMLGFVLHWRPKSFLNAVSRAVPTTTGVLIQFPFYGSITAIMVSAKGLAGTRCRTRSPTSSWRSPATTASRW
jgi:short-chain fatty acids transporter